MLGDIALGCADQIHQILYAGFSDTGKDAKDFQPQWVAHCFEGSRGNIQVCLAGKKKLPRVSPVAFMFALFRCYDHGTYIHYPQY